MIDPSILRELLETVEIPDPYRARINAYGPDAGRRLLFLYDSLKEILKNDPGDEA